MIVGIIPAKSESKRIKNKNFKNFNGKPMIVWTIETAIRSKVFDKIIVSTDNLKIKKFIKKYKVEIKLRPKKLSSEKYGIVEVINYNLKLIKDKKSKICCMFPCAPLMNSEDIKKGYKKLLTGKYNYIFAGSSFSHPIEKAFKLKNNKVKMVFNKKYVKKSSKHLSKSFHDIGYFYWATAETWKKIDKDLIYDKKSSFIEIPNWRAQDIDTEDDWKKTDLIFKSLKKRP